jgi:hypothetical protein
MNPTRQSFHRTRFARAAAVLLMATGLLAGCANTGARAEVTSQGAPAQVAGSDATSPKFSVEALGSAPSEATPAPSAAAPAATAEAGSSAVTGDSSVNRSESVTVEQHSSGGFVTSSGAGNVVARARSTVNGTAYEVLCTRTGGGGQASSVAVRQQTTTENGVVKARVILSTNGNEYPVVVDGVANASALAALNASLTNVSCTVSA